MHIQTTGHLVRQEIIVTRKDILDAVRAKFQVPADAEVTVRVPGGGDWSNTDLSISGECPIKVCYTECRAGDNYNPWQ